MSSSGSRRVLICVAIAELLAKSLWFSGTAVIPQLSQEWHAGLPLASWLTTSVQLGFVAGALIFAVSNLLDVMSAARIFAISGVLGAIFNAAFALVAAEHVGWAFFFRFLTGMAAAGVYPTGMKIVTGWFGRERRGLAMGIVVGAITVGSALPHAVHIGSLPWREVVYVCSGFSLAVIRSYARGKRWSAETRGAKIRFSPMHGSTSQPPFAPGEPRIPRTHVGALFHVGMDRRSSLRLPPLECRGNRLESISFLAIALGLAGCVWAGYVSDRNQSKSHDSTVLDVRARSRVTIIAMATSGACCVLAAIFFNNFPVLVLISIVWGISVVADSAQFSTIVTEVADQRYVGTALTMQTAMGFLLTAVSIRVVAAIGTSYGWRWAALSMAAGPMAGIVAMTLLHRAPHAEAQTPEVRAVATRSR